MSSPSSARVFAQRAVSSVPVPTGFLRRKCACAGSSGGGGACDECSEQKLKVRRSSTCDDANIAVPGIVPEVLSSPGQPLDEQARAFMEPRFGHVFTRTLPTDSPATEGLTVSSPHDASEVEADRVAERIVGAKPSLETAYDFSHVRVHTDAKAAEAAQAINAAAYTVGNHVVFGAGRYSHDTEGRTLLAHELTHVVQDAGSLVQRAKLPCKSDRSIDVYAINLPGSVRDANADITNANDSLCQCGIALKLVGGETWMTSLMDKMPPTGSLNEYTTTGSPTDEEKEMLAHQPGGKALHIYYVPALSRGNEAESFWTSGFPTVNNGVAVAETAPSCVVAHEIGHVLLDDGGHHSNPDNLMASGRVNTCVGELEQAQCDLMR